MLLVSPPHFCVGKVSYRKRMDYMRRLQAVGLSLLLAVGSCSTAARTVTDIQGRSFASSAEFQTWLGCEGQWYATTDGVDDVDLDSISDAVVATANESMGDGERPTLDLAVRTGRVWVLADADGVIVGALEPARTLTWCAEI
jgi:hypothetical protein